MNLTMPMFSQKKTTDIRVALFTMQKNESTLIPLWIKYHGNLFGYENLTILDNNSDCKNTLSILEKAENIGVNVIYKYNKTGDLEKKGAIISQLINERMDLYDFFFALDADELISTEAPDLLPTSPEKLFEELRRLRESNGQFFRVRNSYHNIPGTTCVQPGTLRKLAIKAGNAIELDSGFHMYDWTRKVDKVPNGDMGETNLVLFHFYRRDYENLIESSREKLKSRISNFRLKNLEKYTGGGRHITRYFQVLPDQYYGRYKKISNKIDIGPLFERNNLGPVPFSQVREVSMERVQVLLDPVNYEYIRLRSPYSKEELRFLVDKLRGANSFLQYGLGAASALACEMGVPDVSAVEASIDQIAQVVADFDLQKYINGNRLRVFHAPIGDLLENGVPRFKPTEAMMERYVTRGDTAADLALVEGPYRIATAASLHLTAGLARGLLFPGFRANEAYRVLEAFYRVEDEIENITLLSKKLDAHEKAKKALAKYLFDPT